MSHGTEVQRFELAPDVLDAAFPPVERGAANAARINAPALRVLMDGDVPWFVARDACAVLGLDNVRMAVLRLDSDEIKTDKLSVISNDPSDDLRKVTLVSEPGLYSLIMASRKPQARVFKRWVTHEVLPEIRRTGAYAGPKPPASFAEALELAAVQARALETAQLALADAAPKAEAFDQLMDADGSLSLAQAAQALRLGRDQLIERLALWGAVMVRPGHSDHLRPYQEHVRAGRFVVKVQDVEITHRDGRSEKLIRGTTRVTPKGLEWCRKQARGGGSLDRARTEKIHAALDAVQAASEHAAVTA